MFGFGKKRNKKDDWQEDLNRTVSFRSQAGSLIEEPVYEDPVPVRKTENLSGNSGSIWGEGKDVSASEADEFDKTVSVRTPGGIQKRTAEKGNLKKPEEAEKAENASVPDRRSFEEEDDLDKTVSVRSTGGILNRKQENEKKVNPEMEKRAAMNRNAVRENDRSFSSFSAEDDLDKTISIRSDYIGKIRSNSDEERVMTVGWLVCIEGPGRGIDYRIRQGYNSIGRDVSNDICIREDAAISRIKHALLAYAPVTNRYTIRPEEGRNIIYVNGADIIGATELHAYDKIMIGQSVLLFIPLCNDEFRW